jgi:hypothetical protein
VLTEVEMEVPTDALHDGDVLQALVYPDRLSGARTRNDSWKGMTIRGDKALTIHGTPWGAVKDLVYPPTHRFLVRRKVPVLTTYPTYPVVNGTFSVSPTRRVPDWPHPCPKCRRPTSAVLLFQSWDCKHGCFK